MTEIKLGQGRRPEAGQPAVVRLPEKPETPATGWSPSEWRAGQPASKKPSRN
jgi:hypothetical protein